MNQQNPYEDIIHLSRPVSEKRAKMSMVDRGAQFSPFAALVGYDAAIAETARLTDFRMELTEDARQELNTRLRELAETVGQGPRVSVLWFLPDERKSGGSYVRSRGRVRKVDAYREMLVLEEVEIPFGSIYELERVEE